jgi:excisionase family DNA binding protein
MQITKATAAQPTQLDAGTSVAENDLGGARPAAEGLGATDSGRLRPLPALREGDRLVLSVEEAGRLLGISRAFAYELVARGELPVIRLGRRVVVPKARLFALVGMPPASN